jgi:hypothetical protein
MLKVSKGISKYTNTDTMDSAVPSCIWIYLIVVPLCKTSHKVLIQKYRVPVLCIDVCS